MYSSHSTRKIFLVLLSPAPDRSKPPSPDPRQRFTPIPFSPPPATPGPRGRSSVLFSSPHRPWPGALGFIGRPPCSAAQRWANLNPAIGLRGTGAGSDSCAVVGSLRPRPAAHRGGKRRSYSSRLRPSAAPREGALKAHSDSWGIPDTAASSP